RPVRSRSSTGIFCRLRCASACLPFPFCALHVVFPSYENSEPPPWSGSGLTWLFDERTGLFPIPDEGSQHRVGLFQTQLLPGLQPPDPPLVLDILIRQPPLGIDLVRLD